MKRRLVAILCLFILLPVLPFTGLVYLLEGIAWIFQALADGINWLFENRWLLKFLVLRTEKIEKYFGVDAETERSERVKRIRAAREAAVEAAKKPDAN